MMTEPEITFTTKNNKNFIHCSDGDYLLNWLEANMERLDSEYCSFPNGGGSVGWCVYKASDGVLWRVTFTNKRIDRDFSIKPHRYSAQRVRRKEETIIKVSYEGY